MGLLNKLFQKKETETRGEFPWIALVSWEQLDEMEKASKTRPVAIFKHSTRCGISRMVLKRFEKEMGFFEEKGKLYFLDLLQHRELSKEIASRFQVVHESPQLILLQNGKVVHHASHSAINAKVLEQFVSGNPETSPKKDH